MPEAQLDGIALRPAVPADYGFARDLYFETMRWVIEALFHWNAEEQEARFARLFVCDEVRIATLGGQPVGWFQVQETAVAVNLGQIYVSPRHQRRGIGTRIIQGLLADAARKRKPVTLSVVAINPALRLYERLGFRRIAEDRFKIHMRWDADPRGGPAEADV